MIGLLLLTALFVVSLRIHHRDPTTTSAELRVADAATTSIGLPLFLLWILSVLGLEVSAPVRAGILVVVVLTLAIAFRAPRDPGRATEDSVLVPLGLAGILALAVFATFEFGFQRPLIDPLGHLGWSRDLIDARTWYPVGFPAFNALFSFDAPLASVLRVLPWVIHVAIALQFIALGKLMGSRTAGVLGAFAYLIAPNNRNRLDPAVPEGLAVVFMLASWTVVLRDVHARDRTALRLFAISLVTFVVHLSVIEAVNLIGLVIFVLARAERGTIARRMSEAGAMVGGAVIAVASSPFLRAVFGEKPPLLLSQQPGAVTPLHVKAVAWSWGYGVSLVLSALVVLWILRRREVSRTASGLAITFLFSAALFVVPPALALAGMEFEAQLFNHRLYGWASVFVAMAVTVLAASVVPRSKWFLAGALVLVTGVELLMDPLDPLQTPMALLAAAAALATVFVDVSQKSRALTFVFALLMLGGSLGVRVAAWWPQDPAWLQGVLTSEREPDIVLTNWPALNWIDARTDIEVRDGLAGNDAGLALHRLRELPPLRHDLRWCDGEDPGAVLQDWLHGTDAAIVDIVVNDAMFERAWANHARARGNASAQAGDPSYELLAAPPCALPARERLLMIRTTLGALPGATRTFEAEGTTVYRWVRN